MYRKDTIQFAAPWSEISEIEVLSETKDFIQTDHFIMVSAISFFDTLNIHYRHSL